MRLRDRETKQPNEPSQTDMDLYYSTSSDTPCKRHPSSSSIGICAHCLKDRLVNLICSDCGEQRLSSCSCSEISSNRNSCTVEIGSVGRVSFLIENDETPTLRRSSSTSADPKPRRSNALWGLGKLFSRRTRKRESLCFDDDRSERNAGVSRSRSLCSFRNGGVSTTWVFGSDDGGGGRSSSVTVSGRRSGFSEPRKSDIETCVSEFSGFVSGSGNRRVFSLRESDFGAMDESGFIDLRLDSESEMGFGSMRVCGSESGNSVLESGNSVFGRGGSCRVTVNDKGVKKGRNSRKSWRWIFKNQSFI